MQFDNTKMLKLKINKRDREKYSRDRVNNNKRISKILSKSRQNSKLGYCYHCKKEVTSFCNSHSVPQFCLKRIAEDGKVLYANTIVELPFFRNEQGVKEAGTFQIICNDCDNTIFQNYENPSAYQTQPTEQMLAQIAMKNYLQMIAKRLQENSLYELMTNELNAPFGFTNQQQNVIALDLAEFNASYNRAKIASLGNHNNWYYLCYYKKLDYTVPMAFQGGIVLISDFEDIVINDIYNMDPNYHTKEIHIAVLPLESESVVMMFIDSRDKIYRKFYKQLNKLSLEEQLATINYIIFSYSENVYMSKTLAEAIKDKEFIKTCQKSSNAIATNPFVNPLTSAISSFSLSHRNSIPNFLSEKYQLK